MKKLVSVVLLFTGVFFTADFVFAKDDNLYRQDFTLRLKDGQEMKLSDLSGKPAVIFFYNSRCGCNSYRKMMDKVRLFYRDSELQVIGVGVRENPNRFFKFAEKEGFGFTSGFDITRQIEKNCRVYRLPLTLFVSREGGIVKRTKGYAKEHEVKTAIEKLIS